MQRELHEIQIKILNKLLFAPRLRYVDLRPGEEIENNKLNFHLNQLKELGLIVKHTEQYSLTDKGKEFAGRLDTDRLIVKKQAKISVSVCPIRQTGEEKEYLIYTRLKSPFYGCQGFMSGKVDYAEFVVEAGSRELLEEANLEGTPQIVEIKHYRVFSKATKELLEDKFMFFAVVNGPKGEVKQSNEGKYEWVKESQLKTYVTNHFESWEAFADQLEIFKNFDGQIRFVEEDHYSEKF